MNFIYYTKSRWSILVAFFCLCLFFSCSKSKASSLKKEYRSEYDYFVALNSKKEGNEKEAIRFFKKGLSSSNSKIVRLCAEELTLLGNLNEKNEAANFLLKKYDDEDALLISIKVFFEQGEFNKVINLTENLDLKTSKNELIFYRLESLFEKNDSRFKKSVYDWFVLRPLSSFHEKIYSKFEKEFEGKQIFSSPQKISEVSEEFQLFTFRILVFRKNYKVAFENADSVLKLYEEKNKIPDYQIISDFGKSALYATDDFKISSDKFNLLAKKLNGEEAFCSYFYAARLLERAGRYQTRTIEYYQKALESTDDKDNFFNALWYLLNLQLRINVDEVILTLQKYSSRFSLSSYFDDFFENLSVILLSHGQYKEFYEVWKLIDGKATPDISGKYAYISGRLIEEKLVDTGSSSTKDAMEAFNKVLNNPSPLYYKICTLERMNITDRKFIQEILTNFTIFKKNQKLNEAEKILSGFAQFGFPERIYQFYLEEQENIGIESAVHSSSFLNSCGKFESRYLVHSLRIASRTENKFEGKVPLELLELSYPKNYSQIIGEMAQKYGISPNVLYALVRSESFFDPTISSSQGALGLTQLMLPTAIETARKLKISEDFDVLDPKTNIELGTFYLKSMINRSAGNSLLLALLSYNAGITNVRRWNRSPNIPMDIFLETIPFTETRGYGKKLISATAMYAFLYENIPPAQTVKEFFEVK